MTCSHISRRRFLQAAAGSIAVPRFVSARALGAGDNVAASERITLGSIGVGSRGSGLLNGCLAFDTAQVVAVCDPFEHKCQAAKRTIETRYADRAGKGNYHGCETYNDFRELIGRDDIDAVVIASPGHWHAIQAVQAMKAGKDLYSEKPLSVTIAEGQAMCRTVRRYSRVFQTGTHMRSIAHVRFAGELVQNGYLGRLHTVEVACPGGREAPVEKEVPVPAGLDYEMWVGPALMISYTPHRCDRLFGWMHCYNFVTGWISGWGVHHMDIALFALGKDHSGAIEVEGTAVFPKAGMNDTPISWAVEYTLADGLEIKYSESNNLHPSGVRFKGDKGWVFVNGSKIEAEPASLLKVAIKPDETHLYESKNHMGNFLECVRSRRDPVAPVEAGHAATTLCNIADVAIRLNRRVTWDPAAGSFVDDSEADRMRSRATRSPWMT
ncbi:MAG: Gfo/Idh/MocA family oxidoreductase [Planctomycetes bacterium]|nr:Gfo/Idh/MocA family oxidoreductase [Planctomycetota bacterium]MBL7037476.1 Gfo/Idh/MocA family oxidoreductase [Pirellulaceae bacterium]